MQKPIFLLFVIPILSIVLIGVYQIFDEMKKKKFILERRARQSAEDALAGAQRRRYSDAVPPGSLRNPDDGDAGAANEASVQPVNGV